MKSKIDVQKERLKCIFVNMLATNYSIMNFQKTIAETDEQRRKLGKIMKQTQTAMEIVKKIKHYEILVSLYNTFVASRESYFVMLSSTIYSPKTIKHWDNSEKGFKEFLELDKQARAKSQQEYEEKVKQQELIQKAKEEGKKVEMVYENGKLKPIIVDDKAN